MKMPKGLKFVVLGMLTVVVLTGQNLIGLVGLPHSDLIAQAQVSTGTDQATIRKIVLSKVLKVASEKPTSNIYKITIADRYAIADYILGDGGGVVLLSKTGTWNVLYRGGGSIDLGSLLKYKVPQATAEKLLTARDPSWQNAR